MSVAVDSVRQAAQEYSDLRRIVGEWHHSEAGHDALCERIGHGAEVLHYANYIGDCTVIMDDRDWAVVIYAGEWAVGRCVEYYEPMPIEQRSGQGHWYALVAADDSGAYIVSDSGCSDLDYLVSDDAKPSDPDESEEWHEVADKYRQWLADCKPVIDELAQYDV